MTTFQGRTGRLISGGKLRARAGKKKRELGRPAAETQIANEVKKKIRIRGGGHKMKLYRSKFANVMDRDSGKSETAEIQDVLTNPASRDFSRRRVITKGAILKTTIGRARVTNRPGNEGYVNAVLLADEE